MTILKPGINIPITMLLAVLVLSACADTGFKRQNNYSSYECQRMHGRGLISLEERRKCQFGQAFEFKKDQVQAEPAENKKSAQ